MKGLLIVEGKNDLHVIKTLCGLYDLPESFKIKEKEGINKLLLSVSLYIKSANLDYLGIVIDADSDIEDGNR